MCVCGGGYTYLDLAVKVAGESINPLRLPDGLVAAVRRPSLHPVDDTFILCLLLRPEGTMIQHSRVRHLGSCQTANSTVVRLEILHPINVYVGVGLRAAACGLERSRPQDTQPAW